MVQLSARKILNFLGLIASAVVFVVVGITAVDADPQQGGNFFSLFFLILPMAGRGLATQTWRAFVKRG